MNELIGKTIQAIVVEPNPLLLHPVFNITTTEGKEYLLSIISEQQLQVVVTPFPHLSVASSPEEFAESRARSGTVDLGPEFVPPLLP
jgi:hypothetical protein